MFECVVDDKRGWWTAQVTEFIVNEDLDDDCDPRVFEFCD